MRRTILCAMALCVWLSACGGGAETAVTEAVPPATTAAIVTTAPPVTAASTAAETTVPPTAAAPEERYASMEAAYYAKYCELAGEFGTPALYDIQGARDNSYYDTGRSYLGGVCVVSLMDFDGDGGQNLFVVYANGALEWLENSDSSGLFPTRDSYTFEVWTYADGGLALLLREESVGRWAYFDAAQHVITVVERGGVPVIQLYSEGMAGCEYVNLSMAGGAVVREALSGRKGEAVYINGVEVPLEAWRERALGYDKILLCALLAHGSWSQDTLLAEFGIDYQNTLVQTERVVRHLKGEGAWALVQEAFRVAEEPWVAAYAREVFDTNWLRCPWEDEGEKWYFEHQYALYDMNADGVPELILYEGSSGAGTHHHIYTYRDGEVVHCGDYGRSRLYVDGAGGVIGYHGRMGAYFIDKLELDGTALREVYIDEGDAGHGEYPTLEEYGYVGYRYLPYARQPMAFGFYAYDFDWEVEP